MIRNQAYTGKQSQYGGSCPNCSERHSLDFGEIFITHEDRDHQIDEGNFYARRHVVCISCRATWSEVYDVNISYPDESAYSQKWDSHMTRPHEEGTLNVSEYEQDPHNWGTAHWQQFCNYRRQIRED